MPALVSHTVTTARLQGGDITTDGTVAGVDRKVKWATVTFTSGRSERVLLEDEWTVSRLQKTEDELAAERLDAILHWLDRQERAGIAQLADARDKAATALMNGENVTGWNLLDVVRAQATHALWERVRRSSAYQVQRPDDEQLTRVQVVEAVRYEIQRRLLENTQLTSRSTSQAHNLVEDAEREAQLLWLRDTRGIGED